MRIEWEEGFVIRVTADDGAVLISANRAGLRSLARQFAELAGAEPGTHIHLDEYNSLEDGSAEMIVEIL